ncbi:KUP system potassium uptake protein [Kineosphaera limosa]|uniref:Probable potassium transport system protein Kup n=1 Tax=Kineosphaera limosa NBRC 100340 TaxID=1184609 RepID=K6W9P5_9MICO|nr:KUP/HAK/KT family potassium transporter [Kineosphaera limosa]NYE01287.1 KUP system potassium uptake protein [Kineosphaera limosa]GAB95915.1 putative low affinity potassium transport system protein Kup [Kineosphaera limosa NBRC 100340]
MSHIDRTGQPGDPAGEGTPPRPEPEPEEPAEPAEKAGPPTPETAVAKAPDPAPGQEASPPSDEPPTGSQELAARGRGPLPPVLLAALGVVFGDIGTSPLYALQTVYSVDHNAVEPTPLDVYGVLSLVFWSVMTIVTVKYVVLVMRADNDGEGGILALTALLRRRLRGRRAFSTITLLGIIGAALFYGDSVITPAISVMSAVEGLQVVDPDAGSVVVPVSLTILALLFVIQRFGTELVGRAFGPVMILWFGTLAALGLPAIARHPQVLLGLSPTYAVEFAVQRPVVAFIAMGAIVLTITGAEALYADMGHFGARAIRIAWFGVVFPALTLNYLGQSALILHDPSAVDNPFFRLAPEPLVVPIVVLATAATVIASQAVISGAFSVSAQALHLGLIPRLTVRHTSRHAGGQIYVPAINWALFTGVVVLIVGFGSSASLANAYGLSVTGTLVLTTVLFGGLAHRGWKWPLWRIAIFMVVIGGLEAAFLGANLTKIAHGGWLPIVIASVVITVMTTWVWGAALVRARREEIEGPLSAWLAKVDTGQRGITRVPGHAIYLHTNQSTVPLALKENLRFNHVVHEHVAIVSVEVGNVPHVRHVDRVTVTDIGRPDDGIVAIRIKLGFNDSQDVPHNLRWSQGQCSDFEFDAERARYFLSVLDVHAGRQGSPVLRLRKHLFVLLGRVAGSRVLSFRLPPQRTVILGGTLYI